MKDVFLKQEQARKNIEDLRDQVDTERTKYNNLVEERIKIKERERLNEEDHKRMDEKIDELDKLLTELNAANTALTTDTDTLDKDVQTLRELDEKGEAEFRKLAQHRSFLQAKKKFLEENYDYKEKVNKMNTDEFVQLIDTNSAVNDAMQSFIDQLSQTKTKYNQD